MDWDWGMVDLDPLLKIKVAHRDGGRQPVCLLCLSFALNFPCWGAGEIQLLNSKIKIDSSGESFGAFFLTLAGCLYADPNWHKLIKELKLADQP